MSRFCRESWPPPYCRSQPALCDERRMNQFIRRSFLGMLAGAVASVPLLATLGHPRWSVILGIAVGAAYAAISRPTRGSYVDNLTAAAALRVPRRALITANAFPLASER